MTVYKGIFEHIAEKIGLKPGIPLSEIKLDGKRVLFVLLRSIGDTIYLLPVIENLKKQARNITIDIVLSRGSEEIVAYNPGIRKVLVYDRKKPFFVFMWNTVKVLLQIMSGRYHCVFDFTQNDRGAFFSFFSGAPLRLTIAHKMNNIQRFLMSHIGCLDKYKYHCLEYNLKYLELMGFKDCEKKVNLAIPSFVYEKMNTKLSELDCDGRIKVFIHPGAGNQLKQWKQERFAQVAQRLKNKYNVDIFLVGGANEKELIERVEKFMGFKAVLKSVELSLLEMAVIIGHCQLFIGNDSASSHIAALVGCPSITLFGPAFPQMWRPYSLKGEIIFKEISCRGCLQRKCIRPEKSCMDLIEVEDVWKTIERVFPGA